MNKINAFPASSNSIPIAVSPPISLISAKITDLWKRLVPIEFSETIGKTNVKQAFVYLGIALASTLITYIAMRHYRAAEHEKQAQELKTTKEALEAQIKKNDKQAQELKETRADLNELIEPTRTMMAEVKGLLVECDVHLDSIGKRLERLELHVGKSETTEVLKNPILEEFNTNESKEETTSESEELSSN